MRMSTTGSDASTTAIEPWLTVPDAREASDFYKKAFGAVEAYRLDDDDGRPVVAQLSIGGAAFWIQGDADASPVAPGVGSVRMILSVEEQGIRVLDRQDHPARPHPRWGRSG